MTADVSVVICCYTEDRWDDLRAAIESVKQQSVQPKEIVVVVDHNPTLYRRLQTEVSSIQVVENGEGRGLSGGRNTGVAVTSGSVVAFLDDDAAAEPHWLPRLVAPYADPKVLGVGGRIEPAWQTARPGWFPAEFNWVVGCSYRGLPMTTAPIRNLIGANMSFRREVFDRAGGFRSDLGYDGTRLLGNEETELSIRAHQRWPDGVLLYEPRARVQHRVPASRTRWSYFRSRCYAEGLAKAQTTRLVGAGDGLASEWVHTLRTLPLGVLRGVGDAIWHREPSGIGRAAAITAGLAVTTAGYLVGRFQGAWADRRPGRAEPPTPASVPVVPVQPRAQAAVEPTPDAAIPAAAASGAAAQPAEFDSFGAPIGTPEPDLVSR